MKGLWAIIPVKPLNRAKSRLSDVLTPDKRSQFAETMFRHVLQILNSVPRITGTLVISRDPKALAIARDFGAKTIRESNPSELNPALTRATEIVKVWGASSVLILPADLPFITMEDIEKMVELGIHDKTVVIAPDRAEDGTNAMLINPAGLIPYGYGIESYKRHVLSAKFAEATVAIYESDTVSLDIDVAEDLNEYNRIVDTVELDGLPSFVPDIAS